MPGKILIVDNIATNRIMMKVKLAASCYRVAQAATAAEGLATARKGQPDMIICASQLPDMRVEDFLQSIIKDPETARIPVVVQMAHQGSAQRLALLSAGAADLLRKPGNDKLLLARMRSILRLSELEGDLALRERERHALGMAEDSAQFAIPPSFAILSADTTTAARWQSRLAAHTSARMNAFGFRDAIRQAGRAARLDVFVLMLTARSREAGLQALADLRAKPETRHAGILVVIKGDDAQNIAAEALDLGANDVVTHPITPQEIVLRISRQTMRKRRIQRLRDDMRDGLRAAMTDPLTGLHNRRYAIPRLTQIAAEAEKHRCTYAVMAIDIDHFKLINDQHGHAAGDSVLMRVADVLKSTLGPQGLLARIGGDEFLAALPDTGPLEAELMAKRLCRAVRESRIPTAGAQRRLQTTVSIGVAVAPARRGKALGERPSPEMTLERADQALYGAKARGRNRVVSLDNARSAA